MFRFTPKRPFKSSLMQLALCCVVLSPVLTYPQLAQARPVSFKPPAGSGTPRTSQGGASRGNVCSVGSLKSNQKLSLLLPASNIGLTASARPTFFSYLPPTSAKKIFFSLRDEQGQVHYQATLPITGQEEVIRIQLPETVANLEANKDYQWGVAILCGNRLRADSPRVSGWVRHTPPSRELAAQLTSSSPLQQAALYGENGFWFDTLRSLDEARVHRTNDTSLISSWKQLLDSVGLTAAAQVSAPNQ